MNFEGHSFHKESHEPIDISAFETIASPALMHDPDGEIITGFNHGDAREIFHEKHPEATEEEDEHLVSGFLTNKGRFVLRPEAVAIADRAEQIKDKNNMFRGEGELSSEDLVR